METLSPASYILSSNWVMQQESKKSGGGTKWTKEQNKWFESALAIFDTETPDRWSNVAALVPGKSEYDVKKQYEELEADISDIENGNVPIPSYETSSFKLELVDDDDDEDHHFRSLKKKPSKCRSFDQERRKGVPWTEDEHRRFLMGLQVHGKGDWRNISRNFVITKTPTQVASHAQKYYARQHSDGKEKRRPSIHDITMVHLTDNSGTPTTDENNRSISIPLPQKPTRVTTRELPDWNNNNYYSNDRTLMVFDTGLGNSLMAYPFEIAPPQGLIRTHKNGGNIRVYNSGLHFQPTRYQVRG